MTITYKALAALLSYPTAELFAALPDIHAAIDREGKFRRAERRALSGLVAELGSADLLDAQERYVEIFDRGRATSLHLFEHVHGESRDRGQAMVDLNATYAQAGLTLASNELPDYLPVLLEYLSLQPESVARDMLEDCGHIVRKIGDTLVKRGSTYAAVFAAVLSLGGQRGLGTDSPSAEDRDCPLDDEWFEAPVVFGAAAGATCGTKASEASIVRFMPRERGATRDKELR